MRNPLSIPTPDFDKKFKVIIETQYTDYYLEQLDWVHIHSNGEVEVRVVEITHNMMPDTIYFGFTDPDDALVFKIKYRV